MVNLKVFIEISGQMQLAGFIKGNDYRDASFSYAEEYLEIKGIKPISISLPLGVGAFSPEKTRNYFEGLLPEGFSRRAVSNWARVAEEDYIGLLSSLGGECLGAIQILEAECGAEKPGYEEISEEEIKALAGEGATKSTEILTETHLSLTGASGKVGLYLDKDSNRWYLPKGTAPSTHIVKQSHIRFERIVLNEMLCLETAGNLGINVPEHFVISEAGFSDGNILFATGRYDRKESENKFIGSLKCPLRLHQEDFSQCMGIPSNRKYEDSQGHYLKNIFELVNNYSFSPLEDKTALWDRVVFNCLMGNTDGHIKNFSFLYADNLKSIRLAPAYDIICTLIYGTNSELSFNMGGERNINKLSRESFKNAAKEAQISEKLALRRLDYFKEGIGEALNKATETLTREGFTDAEEVAEKIKKAIKEIGD